jgi:sugar lactone lactonase YvrE
MLRRTLRLVRVGMVALAILPAAITLGGRAGIARCEEPGSQGPRTRSSGLTEPVVVASGAPIHGASGLRFDAQNRLHVASVLGDEILVMDPATGEVISTIGANAGVVGPDDLAFGPDGSLYWTSFSTGEVGRISPEGTRTGQSVGPGVNGITFSPDGRLFVTVVFMGDALYELDPELTAPPRLVASKFGFMNGIDWGPDGALYGPLWTKGEVVRVNVDTGELTAIAGGFNVPAALKFGPDGRIYVVEQATGRVQRLNPADGAREVAASFQPGLDNLAFDNSGHLFVSHGQDGCVSEVLPDGTARAICGCGMIAPGGVALVEDPVRTLYVADFWTLRGFDPVSGNLTRCLRHSIGVAGGVTSPFTVSADGTDLILTSWLPRDMVQVFDLEAGTVVEEYADFDDPVNAIRFRGDLVVVEGGKGRLVRIPVREPKKRVILAKGLVEPIGLAATESDLWVSDHGTGSVLQVVANGRALDTPVPVATGLASPEGLAVDRDGGLLVVEPEIGRLSRIEPGTRLVSTLADGFPPCLLGDHPTWIFNGVAVGAGGSIYLTSDVDNRVYRIDPKP